MTDQAKGKKEYKPKRYFISPVNTYQGNIIVQQLRNDNEHPENPNLILGTIAKNEQHGKDVPQGVRKIIDQTKFTFLAKVILDSDVIIYDLMNCDQSEAEFAIKTLKMGDLKEEKLLILISSVMVWSATPPKEKKEGDEAEEGEPEEPDSDIDKQEEEKAEGGEDAPVKKEYLRFTENDYTRRRALPKYEAFKALETMCLSAGSAKKFLRSYVLCAGVLYGMGEEVFKELFKSAWLQEPKQLSYYGEGRNRIPTIHVKDLALFVQKIAERPPQMNYIFAIDHNIKPQQKKIIASISKGVGTGDIVSIKPEGYDHEDTFLIDLRMRPTKAFDQFLEEANQQEDGGDEVVDVQKYTFNWWCKEGIQKNIEKINKEFNENNNLKPIRVFIQGPPAVGKSYLAKQIAEYYNLPQIQIKDVIDQYKNIQSEEAEALRTSLEEQRTTLIEEAQAQWEQEKKKKKALGQIVEPFDEQKVQAKLNDAQLYAAIKWRLMQNDCQNRGYVLDGYPRTYADGKGIFLKPEKQSEEEEKEDDIKILNEKINPHSVIILNAQDEFLLSRVQQIPEQLIIGTHYTPEGMKRRLNLYRNNNKSNTGWPILVDFFKENGISIMNIDSMNSQNKIFDQTRSFIERNGRFKNYRERENEKEANRLLSEQQKKQQFISQQEQLQIQRDQKEMQMWKLQEEEYRIKQEHSRNYERELLDSRSQPLRQYLNDNVVPFITEGIVQLIKQKVDDPVDFLAEFLFKRSLQVNCPDPGKYFQEFNRK